MLVTHVSPSTSTQIGFTFAPIIFLWLFSNAIIGCVNIATYMPTVFKALSPYYVVRFFQ